MRILFVCSETLWPGVAFLSSYLKAHGHEVALLLDHLVFNNEFFHHAALGRAFDKKPLLEAKIRSFRPDLAAFSINSSNYQWALAMARHIKLHHDLPIMVGGILPTIIPDEVISQSCFDVVCLGEGEEPMLQYADAPHRTDIPGLWFKSSDGVIRNAPGPLVENLDQYPMPDVDLFYEQLPWTSRYLADVIVGRGCPYNCSFCSITVKRELYQGRGRWIRQRSVDHVMHELIDRKNRHHTRIFDFKNEVFATSMQWLREFSKEYRRHIDLPFYCYFSPNMANEECISILKESGCRCIHFGLQSGNEQVRRGILNRNEKDQHIFNAADYCRQYGIHFSAHCILDLPGETMEDIRVSLKTFNHARPDDVSVYRLLYFPKSPIIRTARELNLLSEEDERRINSGQHNMNPRTLVKGGDTRTGVDYYKRYAALFTAIPLLPKAWVERLIDEPGRLERFQLSIFWVPLLKIITLTRGGWGLLLPFLVITEVLNGLWHIRETRRVRRLSREAG